MLGSRITKNLQNIGGGSLTLGTTPAYANIDMAGNSISNLNQINGQIFPTGPGGAGYFLSLSGDGKTMKWMSGLGTVGATGAVGPTGPVGGSAGQILFNNGSFPSAAGSSFLTFNSGTGLTTMSALSVTNNLNVVGNISGNFGCNAYTIASVQLSNGTISNAIGSSNSIGGWMLSNSVLDNGRTSILDTGAISTPDSVSNSIGGVALSNGTIVNLVSSSNYIGGWVLGSATLNNGSTSIASTGRIATPAGVSNSIGGVALSNGTISNAAGSSNTIGGVVISNSVLGVGVTPGAYALNVSGTGFVSGTLNVSGDLISQGALEVQGTSLSAGSAVATFSATTITNSLSTGSLFVLGTSTLSDSVTLSNSLTVGGSSISAGSAVATVSALNVWNRATISGLASLSSATVSNALTVLGNISAGSSITTFSALNVWNDTNISGLLTVSGAYINNNLTAAKARIAGLASVDSLNVIDGDTNLLSTYVDGILSVTLSISAVGATATVSALNVGNAVTISGLATLSAATVRNALTLLGTVSAGNVDFSIASLTVSGAVTISGLTSLSAASILNTLTVGGTSISAGSAVLTVSSLNVRNAVNISGLATLSGATVQNNLTVQGTTLSAGSALLSVSGAVVKTTLSVGQIAYIPDVETLSILNGTPVNISGGAGNIILGTSYLNTSAGSNVVSVGNSAAISNTGVYVNSFGYYAGSNNTASYTNALGYYAGASNIYSNCTFIGSNPNTAVRYVPSSSSTIIANIGPDVDNDAGNAFNEYIVTGNDGNNYCAVQRNYAPSPAYSSIFRISPTSTISSGTPYGTYTVLSSVRIACPVALIQAADASDSLYILNWSNSKIVKFSQTSGTFSLMYGGANPPTSAFSSYGLAQSTLTCNFYFTNTTDSVTSTIQKVEYTTGDTTLLSAYPVFFRAITYASDNYLYSWVVGGDLYKIDPTSGTSSVVGNYVNGYNVNSLYGGVPGYVYLTYTGNGPVLRISLSDYTSTTVVPAGAGNPCSITQGAGEVLYGVTAYSKVVVYGTPAFTYLPGVSQANTFAVYSTSAGVNTIHADISNNYVGIGRVPGAYSLDVAGTTRTSNMIITGSLTMAGSLTIPDTLNVTTLNVTNNTTISGLATISAAVVQTNLTVSGLTTLSGTITTTLSATSLRTSTLLGITSINTMSATINSDSNNFLIGGASGPYVAPLGSYVTAIGKGAALGSTGSNIVGLGYFGGASSTGAHINAIGYQAGFLATADYQTVIGYQAGKGSTATNLTAIGYTAGENNKGTSNIALGDFAGSNQSGSSNVALGLRTLLNNSGSLTVGIGYNAGVDASANGCIYIGRGAGSNNYLSNSIFLGSNPGYSAGSNHNQFVVYSMSSAVPLIQGDLSYGRVGIGKAPGPYALDVSGTIQTNDISLARLNGLVWPSGTPGADYVPTYRNGIVSWQPGAGGGGGASAWASYPATQQVDLSGFDLSGLVSINSISAVFANSRNNIGLGSNVLSGNTGSNLIALGTNAGAGGQSNSNVVYIGSNSGYDPASSDTFVVYSTNSRLPLIQADLSAISVGIGRVPRTANALDVSGQIAASNVNIPVVGGVTNTLGPITTTPASFVGIGTASPGYQLDVAGTINATNIKLTSTGLSNTIGGISVSNTTLSAATVVVPTLSNVSLLNGWNLATSSVAGNFNIGTLFTASLTLAVSIGLSAAANASGANIVAFGSNAGTNGVGNDVNSLGWNAAYGSSGSNVNALGNSACTPNSGSDVNALGNNAAGRNSGSVVNAFGPQAASRNTGSSVNAMGSTAALGNTASDVNAFGYQAAYENSGENANAIGVMAAYRNTGDGVSAVGGLAGYSNTGANLNAMGLYSGRENTGDYLVSIGFSAGSNNRGSYTVGLGWYAACSNSGVLTNAIGSAAGYKNTQSNCTFIGSNPNYPTSSGATAPNTFLVYSTSPAAPTIQADTSNNRVGIGRVPGAYALDVSGTIRTTSNIVNTINVSLISSSTVDLLTDNYSTYFNLTNPGTTMTISLPGSLPIQGSYWVIKNNSVANYTLNFTGGTLNTLGGPTSMYLQAGNGLTLIYAGSNSVYYTF